MSHLFIVQSENTIARQLVFAQGLSAFHHCHGLSPIGHINEVSTCIALFPLRLATTPGIVQICNASLCGAGTWFYQRQSGEQGLRRIAADMPVLEDAYLKLLCEIDGWFTIASLQTNGVLFVITDRLGEFHVYLARTKDCLLISTSSIVLGVLTSAPWDLTGCRQFLAMGTIFEPSRTLFANVSKMDSTSLFRCQSGKVQAKKYWDVASIEMSDEARPQRPSLLAKNLSDAVTTISATFTRPVVDLTGGFDTRGILGAVIESGLSLDFVVNGPSDDLDVIISKQIAQEFGLRHRHLWSGFECAEQWWKRAKESLCLVDGEQDILYYAPILEVHSQLARDFNASVNGNVGEICQGHWWEVCFPFLGSKKGLDPRLIASRRLMGEDHTDGLIACDVSDSLVEQLTEVVRRENSRLIRQPKTMHMDNVYLALWEQRFYGRTVSATNHLWPSISPYGFRGPLEVALSTCWQDRVCRRLTRRLIEYQSPRLAALPTSVGGPATPLRINNAQQFLPLANGITHLIGRRLASKCGINLKGESPIPGQDQPWLSQLAKLCALEEVRELLDRCGMASRELYNLPQLRMMLRHSPAQRFSPTAWPGRVLTIELLARLRETAAFALASAC